MRTAIVIGLLALTGCGSAPVPEKQSAAVHTPPADETALFPLRDRQETRVVPDHLLGKPFMPGGTIGEYQHGASRYQLFVARLPSSDKAAFLLLDFKKALSDAKYLAHMGGYFGMDAGRPVYVFAKRDLLAGVVGLPREQADAVAREFAARLK